MKPKLWLVAECCPSLLTACTAGNAKLVKSYLLKGTGVPLSSLWGTLLTLQQLAWFSMFFWVVHKMHWGVEIKLCNNPVSWICSSITYLYIYQTKQCLMFWSKNKVFSPLSSFVCRDGNRFPTPFSSRSPWNQISLWFTWTSLHTHLCSI